MLPFSKAKWVVGNAGLSIILEQDRRHWLLKTDRLLQVQDETGSMYQGTLDNSGNLIRLETQKLPEIHTDITGFEFYEPGISNIFATSDSALPFTYQLNGLACVRVASAQYNYQTAKKNYKLRFSNAEIVHIPYSNSAQSDDVYLFRFIKTSTQPMIVFDDNGTDIEVNAGFASQSAANVVYYYPMEDFQPFEIIDMGNGVYDTEQIDDSSIGLPLYWFTCDETNLGPMMKFNENFRMFFYGNPGNGTRYSPNVYSGIEEDTSGYSVLTVNCMNGYTFSNSAGDFNTPLDPESFVLHNNDPQDTLQLQMNISGNNVITMASGGLWEYVDETTYRVQPSAYSLTNEPTNSDDRTPLKAIFNIQLDESVPFTETTTDVNFVGVNMASVAGEYPYNLGAWDGLPAYLAVPDSSYPRMAAYAIHDTPSSSEETPMTRQTAGLLFDPGKPSLSENSDLGADEIGRVYVLSNDSIDYENNAVSQNPKPARTAARICDIPSSIVNLIDISGVAPTPIVDPKYVRSEASYTADDQDRIANVLNSKWVRPTNVDINNNPIYGNYPDEDNIFVFQTMDGLNHVDLRTNGFREKENLNAMVQTSKVSINQIIDEGSGYATNDIGNIIVGGFAFTYSVTGVGDGGVVTSVALSAPNESEINLANFDMYMGTAVTDAYGTSPLTGNGTGLKVQLIIDDFDELQPTEGDVYDDLYAYVVTSNGLYIASFNTTTRKWVPTSRLCDYQISDTSTEISYKDAYINTIIPSVRELPIQPAENAQRVTSIQVLATSNFVNIIDSSKSPVDIAAGRGDIVQTEQVVDMNKWCMSWPKGGTASSRTTAAVINWINIHDKPEYDSYLAWVWEQPQDASNLNFTYMFIRRSFSNLQSYDNVNLLPNTDIPYTAYVNTDRATTIVWNVPNVGPLLWVFDPTSTTHERYYLDPNTRDLGVSRQPLTWKDVDQRTGQYDIVYYVSAAGKWRYRFNLHKIGSNGTFEAAPFATYGSDYNDTDYQPTGSWKLVYPRIHTYHLSTDTTNPAVEFTPARLQVLHASNIQNSTNIIDQFGQPVNAKTLVVEDSVTGAKLKVFNQSTGSWDIV